MKKIFVVLFVIIISLFVLTGCKQEENTEELLNSKVNSELDYIEDVVFNIVKSYLLGDYQKEDTISWDEIKTEFSVINQSSSVMVSDFSNKNFSDDDILKFENLINNVNLAIQEENEVSLFTTLANLYVIVPEYMEKYTGYEPGIDLKRIKNINLYSYISCIQGNYEEADILLGQALDLYLQLSKNTEYVKEKGFVMNKLYIVIEEYRMILGEQNLELATIKYLNTLSI